MSTTGTTKAKFTQLYFCYNCERFIFLKTVRKQASCRCGEKAKHFGNIEERIPF